jgi:Ni/Fe-hydrogenase subunit HybB-like protein
VSTYLWTKSVAAGLPLAALAMGAPINTPVASVLSLMFLALTVALLVLDLKRPERFLYILLKPNWRSWLVWGAWILLAFGVLQSVGLLLALGGRDAPWLLAAAIVLLALASAGYSAFLFGQAEGRDFWQSGLTLPHLIAACLVAGNAVLLVVFPGWADLAGSESAYPRLARAYYLAPVLAVALVLHGALVILEVTGRHASLDAARAAALLVRGSWRVPFWGGAMLAGVVMPIALLLASAIWEAGALNALAALLALAGLWLYEDLWVRAGQSIPLS